MLAIEPSRTALLVMDFQSDTVAMLGDKAVPLLDRSAEVVAAARKAKLPVLYVVVGFRPGYPEIGKTSLFSRLAQSGRYISTTPGADIVPAVRPQADDVIVVKHRVSAFFSTDLEMLLRAKGIDTLVLTGIATSGVVLSTARHGLDADYRLVIVKDCCADADEEVHRVLMEKVLARQATVIAASELLAALPSG